MSEISENVLYANLLLVFIIILLVISAFLAIQIVKGDKIARPFLLSLLLYFAIIAFGHFFQMSTYLVKDANPSLGYQYLFTAGMIYLIAPIPLIYQLEKNIFQDYELLSKRHLLTILILGLLTILFTLNTYYWVTEPDFFDTYFIGGQFNIGLTRFMYIAMPIWFLQHGMMILAFLYLGIKTVEKYRLYSLLISFGWFLNHLVNVIFQSIPTFQESVISLVIFFVIKWIGAVMVAFYLFKLYNLKREL